VPGQLDDWNRVQLISRISAAARRTTSALLAPLRTRSTAGSSSQREGAPARRRAGIVALIATVVVVGGGTVAYGAANKTVSVDVDGTVTLVNTYAGSVEGVLEARGISVGTRDTVAPQTSTSLRDGSEIVVRHATLVKVQVDGAQTDLWTTALSADEALATLSGRGGDVRLVASRSSSGGRAELPLELTLHGPVDILADGAVLTAPDGSIGLAAVLDEFKLKPGPLDRVSVQHAGNGKVTVVVNRVAEKDVTKTTPVAFTSSEKKDASLLVGEKKVSTAGVAGIRTTVSHVRTVDGVVAASKVTSDKVTKAPVNRVVSVGTKARPVAPKPAPAAPAAPAAAAPAAVSPNVGGGADSLNWAALAQCESGGNPTAVSSSGTYYGLYQFSVQTWAAMGGSGTPSSAPASEQTMRAKMLYNASGAGQWPVCGAKL
jgi:uncharacterized protein YabE (DUF348 family)